MKLIYLISLCIILAIACTPKHRVNYMLDETELVPEGIDYSEATNKFYLTSLARSKIISVDKETWVQKNFIDPEEYGFMPGVGIFADDERNRLLALAGYYMLPETHSTLFEFDLSTGELIQKYAVQDSGRHFLNDLIVAENGDVYMTDTNGSAVYLLEENSNELEVWMQSDEIRYPNGIAISNDNSKLYVASHAFGVRIIDLQSKNLLNEPDTTGRSNGIDGLEFYKNNLYAVQNGVSVNGDNFRRLELNDAGDRITGATIIDSDTPELNVPLTFCIAEEQAVVIGNSNLQFLNQQDYSFTEPDSLTNTQLLVYDLE